MHECRQLRLFISLCSMFYSRKLVLNYFQLFFKKHFKNIKVDIADYQTDVFKRDGFIRSSDLILYVLTSHNELESLRTTQIKIGQISYQFDHDRIRYVDKYRLKCINVLFKQTTDENLHYLETTQTKLINKLLRKGQKMKHTLASFLQNLEYMSLPHSNMELFSLVTNAFEINQDLGRKSIRGFLVSFSTKLIFYKVHRSILERLDNSNIHDDITKDLVNYQNNRESNIVERIIFRDTSFN